MTQYGLDAGGRIVLFRGWRPNIRAGEAALWFSPEEKVSRMAYVAPVGAKRPERLEATTYFYDDGRMVKSVKTAGVRTSGELQIGYTNRWFRYDDAGRLVLVVWIYDEPPGWTTLHPRAQRLTWSQTGELELVTETYGRESVERAASEAEQLCAVLEWQRRADISHSVQYDARVDRVETQIPPEEEIYDGLDVMIADAIEAAAAAAAAQGRVRQPFLLLAGSGSSTSRPSRPRPSGAPA